MRPRIQITFFLVGLAVSFCQTSGFLLYREVRYNFSSEGFLSPGLLQTIGKSEIEAEIPTDRARKLCRNDARELAERRMLRVFLHTKFELRPGSGDGSFGESDFERDYPVRFSPVEILEARSDFQALLGKSYIAVEDFRSRKNCLIVLRLAGTDLPSEIRATKSSYSPPRTRKVFQTSPRVSDK